MPLRRARRQVLSRAAVHPARVRAGVRAGAKKQATSVEVRGWDESPPLPLLRLLSADVFDHQTSPSEPERVEKNATGPGG